MRKHSCPACNAIRHGIKSRSAFEHIGCEFDKHTVALHSVKGSATFIGKPDEKTIEAVNEMAALAFRQVKKK